VPRDMPLKTPWSPGPPPGPPNIDIFKSGPPPPRVCLLCRGGLRFTYDYLRFLGMPPEILESVYPALASTLTTCREVHTWTVTE